MEFLEAVTSALRALLQMLASNNIPQVSFLDMLASNITVSTIPQSLSTWMGEDPHARERKCCQRGPILGECHLVLILFILRTFCTCYVSNNLFYSYVGSALKVLCLTFEGASDTNKGNFHNLIIKRPHHMKWLKLCTYIIS